MNWDGRLPGGKGWVLGSERSRARAVVRGGLVLLAGLVTVAVAASILYGALGGLRPTRPMVGGVRGTPETGRRRGEEDGEELEAGSLGSD